MVLFTVAPAEERCATSAALFGRQLVQRSEADGETQRNLSTRNGDVCNLEIITCPSALCLSVIWPAGGYFYFALSTRMLSASLSVVRQGGRFRLGRSSAACIRRFKSANHKSMPLAWLAQLTRVSDDKCAGLSKRALTNGRAAAPSRVHQES